MIDAETTVIVTVQFMLMMSVSVRAVRMNISSAVIIAVNTYMRMTLIEQRTLVNISANPVQIEDYTNVIIVGITSVEDLQKLTMSISVRTVYLNGSSAVMNVVRM